jgi:catechol 2,3-dioxygenase-like lactoylglutathione lyase family enzyme
MTDQPQQVFAHVALRVADPGASYAFYAAALAPLGLVLDRPQNEDGGGGFGAGGTFFFVRGGEPLSGPTHVAFNAADRAAVDAFHAAGLAAGGTDNGGPGVRENYHPNYYAAFVIDPDGHNIEAVCQTPAP